jgi:hypothetical protein
MFARVSLVVLSVAFTLAVAECFLRLRGTDVHDFQRELSRYAELQVLHSEGGYLMSPPSASVVLFGHTAIFNSFGMRDPEPSVPKPEGIFRILLIGDSVTFGQGVAQEDIFPSRLRERLRSMGVDVGAAAVPGWNTLEEERFLNLHVNCLAPDLVLLMYVANDREPDDPFRRARKSAEGFRARLYRSLVVHSRLFEWTAFLYAARFDTVDEERKREFGRWLMMREPSGEPFGENDTGWRKSAEALLRMNALLKARNAKFVLLSYRIRPGGPWQQAHDRLVPFGRSAGIPVVDTLPFVSGHRFAELANNVFVDPHPNALAHRLLADGILRTLRERGWIPTGKLSNQEPASQTMPAPDARN